MAKFRLDLSVSLLGASVAALSALHAGAAAAQPDPGRAVFERWCAECHARPAGAVTLRKLPGTSALTRKYGAAKPGALEDRRDLTPEIVKAFVRTGVASMPPFRKTEVDDDALDALAAYLAHVPPR